MASTSETPKSTSRLGFGRVIHSQAREIIANVLEFMQEEAKRKDCIIPIANYRARVLAATKISLSSYHRIFKATKGEQQPIKDSTVISPSPPRKRNVLPRQRQLMEWQTDRIRNIVHRFYLTDGRRPTLNGIYFLFLVFK